MGKKNKHKLVIAGCVAQAEGKEIKKRASSVDYIVGPQSYHKLPSMIENNNSNLLNSYSFFYHYKNNISISKKLSILGWPCSLL